MRYVLVIIILLLATPVLATPVLAIPVRAAQDLILPTVDFSATDVQESGAFLRKETIHYSQGKLRIDRGDGFSTTVLDFKTQTDVELMANHTYLVLPMDDELYRRFIPHTVAMSATKKIGLTRMAGLNVTKYAFGEDGALNAAGTYWLTDTGIMIRREYDDGVFGANVHHVEYLTHIRFAPQPPTLFEIPPGYRPAK